MGLTPAQRILRARMAAFSKAAQYDGRQATAAARAAFLAQFEPTDPHLPPAERNRRYQAAKKAHFLRLALASSRARKRQTAA